MMKDKNETCADESKSRQELIKELKELRILNNKLEIEKNLIKQAENWIEEIFKGLSTATLIIDHNHKIIEWNKALEDMTGIKREGVIGTKDSWKGFYKKRRPVLADLIIDKRIDEINEFYEKIGKAKHVADGYTAEKWVEINENKMYLLFTSVPIFDLDGNMAGAVETFEDITDLKKAEERLIILTTKDVLTCLYNRRKLMELLSSEFERTKRYKDPLTVGMMDLDHFKQINDKYGHDVGDKVLRRTAKAMKDELRKTDVCGRYGGEEFCIVLTNTNIKKAYKFLERLREKIAALKFSTLDGTVFGVTISIGIAEYNDSIKNEEELLKLSDQSLYHAKETGRNRVSIFYKGSGS